MTSKDKFRLGLAAVLLAAAGAVFAVLSSISDIPSDPEAKTLWYCAACRSGFELTGPQTAEAVRQKVVRPPVANADGKPLPRLPGVTSVEVVACPFCKQLAGVPARRCPNCGEVFPVRTENGGVAVCSNPDCQWDPTTGRKAEGAKTAARKP
jgi:hypothetical protein